MKTPDVLDPKTYLPKHLVKIAEWICPVVLADIRTQLLFMAHEADCEEMSRDARVALAKLEWVKDNMEEGSFQIQIYALPLREFAIAHSEWYDLMLECGHKAGDLVHQVCIAFDETQSLELYKAGTSEIY